MAPDIKRFRKQPCPFCGSPLDAAAKPDLGPVREPIDGDFMVCVACAEPSVFRVTPLGQTLAKPTTEELARFAVDYGNVADHLREFNRRL